MKFCKITTNDDELAMELYQETMLRMVEHYKKLEVSENIKAWAISTAINLWKNKKRKYLLSTSFHYLRRKTAT